MHLQKNETTAIEALLLLALARADLVLMKRSNTIRNHGQTPERCLAEAMATVYLEAQQDTLA